MQINLFTTLQGPSGEATTKSTETAGAGSASSFFAQMGQLWNPDDEDQDSQTVEKPGAQNSNKTGVDPMTMLPGATMLSLNPIKSEPVQNTDLSMLSSPIILECGESGEDAQGSNLAEKQDKSLDKSMPAAIAELLHDPAGKNYSETAVPAASPEATQLQTPWTFLAADASTQSQAMVGQSLAADHEMYTIMPEISTAEVSSPVSRPVEENYLQNSPFVSSEAVTGLRSSLPDALKKIEMQPSDSLKQKDTSLPVSQNVLPDSGAKPEESGAPGEFLVSQTPSQRDEYYQAPVLDKPGPSASLNSEENPGIAEHIGTPEERHGTSVMERMMQNETETLPDDLAASVSHAEFRQESFSRPGLSAVNDAAGDAERPSLSRDSKAEGKSSQTLISKKFDNLIKSASDNADAGGFNANRDQANNEVAARHVVRGKSEDGQTTVRHKSQLPATDRSQEMQSALASNPAGISEPNKFADALPPSTSTTQPRELVFQLADQIQIQLREGKGEICIQLKPDSLGRIEIKAETTLSGVTARITTESGNVKTYLENNLQLLQQTLSDQGLRVDRINIIVQDALDSRFSSGHGTQFGHAGSGRNGRDSEVSSDVTGSPSGIPSDEITVDPQTWLALNPNNRFYTVA